MAQGLYVETLIRGPIERVWALTQEPQVHEQWDLRFSSITYLPRPDPAQPQTFLYTTRIGFGIAIEGTGSSIATRQDAEGTRTSSLHFSSQSPMSLIAEGSGYWKYRNLATENSTVFLTWYDYTTRYGVTGRVADLFFRPLLGWATAWSFDRLRLWVEQDCPPKVVLMQTLIYTVTRLTVCCVWMWHGLVPKLLFCNGDEVRMLHESGLGSGALPWIGGLEIAIGLVGLLLWRWRAYLVITALSMVFATVSIALRSREYLTAAFNPVTLNACMIALCCGAWTAWRFTAFAGRCRRSQQRSSSYA